MKVTVQKVWNNRPHKITLYSPKEVDVKAVTESTIVKPDGKTYDVTLATPFTGLHRVEVVDGGDYTRIVWPEGMPVMMPSAIDSRNVTTHFRGRWSMYCYVPKGTTVVAGLGRANRRMGPPHLRHAARRRRQCPAGLREDGGRLVQRPGPRGPGRASLEIRPDPGHPPAHDDPALFRPQPRRAPPPSRSRGSRREGVKPALIDASPERAGHRVDPTGLQAGRFRPQT